MGFCWLGTGVEGINVGCEKKRGDAASFTGRGGEWKGLGWLIDGEWGAMYGGCMSGTSGKG